MNATLADLGNEIGSSLDRTGRGPMLAQLRNVDGNVAAPAVAFNSEPASGLYRAGAGDVRVSVSGVDAVKLLSNSVTLPANTQHSVLATGTNAQLHLRGNRDATDVQPDVALNTTNTRTAGVLVGVFNHDVLKLVVDYLGLLRLDPAGAAAAIQPASIVTGITPGAGWTAGGGLGFWKSADGIVRLRGNITGGLGSSIFTTLPAGFRPASPRVFSVPWSGTAPPAANDGFYFVQVSSNGIVTAPVNSSGTIWYLDGINFLAEQ